jgi:DNA-binding transcriptional ArsR family regulator
LLNAQDFLGMQEYSQPSDPGVDRALDHPTRRAILDLLVGEKGLGPSSISEKLGIPAANAVYHVDVLLACGAVEAVPDKRGERIVRLPQSPPKIGKDGLEASGSMREDVSPAQLKSLIEMASHLRPRPAPGA